MKNTKKQALLFLLLLGVISLLSDFTHEGARSIYGPYLGLLGVSAFLISFTSGLGEFIGQALRLVTGYIADKTKKYWLMMIVGYTINLSVIPLLYFVDASIWQIAIILILLERIGKAVRAPAKSALASFVTPHLGAGKTFALQEVMDQIGAFLGPVFVFFIIGHYSDNPLLGYQVAFGMLGIFAVVTIITIIISRVIYPNPDQFDTKVMPKTLNETKAFILYMVAVSLIALGFMDFPIIAYHIDFNQLVSTPYIPLVYAFAMGIDAVAALVFGTLFDKIGLKSLQISILLYALFTPLFFLVDGALFLWIGIALWGIGMGAQESILKAVISLLVPKDKRATAYGLFYTVFGGTWFLGSLLIGLFYEYSIPLLVTYTTVMEIGSIVVLQFIKTNSNT